MERTVLEVPMMLWFHVSLLHLWWVFFFNQLFNVYYNCYNLTCFHKCLPVTLQLYILKVLTKINAYPQQSSWNTQSILLYFYICFWRRRILKQKFLISKPEFHEDMKSKNKFPIHSTSDSTWCKKKTKKQNRTLPLMLCQNDRRCWNRPGFSFHLYWATILILFIR